MIKKKSIAIIIIILVILISFLIYNSNKKIYLSSVYYNKGEYIDIDNSYLEGVKKDNYLLYTYNSYCTFKIPCDKIFKEVMDKYKIDVLSMPIEEFKRTNYYKKVRYAPTLIVVKKGKIKAYLDPNSDDDFNKYQDSKSFEKWLGKYIYLQK